MAYHFSSSQYFNCILINTFANKQNLAKLGLKTTQNIHIPIESSIMFATE